MLFFIAIYGKPRTLSGSAPSGRPFGMVSRMSPTKCSNVIRSRRACQDWQRMRLEHAGEPGPEHRRLFAQVSSDGKVTGNDQDDDAESRGANSSSREALTSTGCRFCSLIAAFSLKISAFNFGSSVGHAVHADHSAIEITKNPACGACPTKTKCQFTSENDNAKGGNER